MKKTMDMNLQLKDSAAVTATAAAQVSGAAKVIDLGAGRVDAKVINNVTAINNTAAANKYTLTLQGSNTADMSTGNVTLAKMELGHATALGEAARSTGVWEQPFTNELNGTVYRYVRQYITIAGSPVSITHEAWIAKSEGN